MPLSLQTLLPVGLMLIMFEVGLTLHVVDFRRLIEWPRIVALGLASQMLLLPCLALLIVALVPLPVPVAIGVVLIAACPGGVTSSFMTLLARGDVALSVSLTALSTLASLLTLPWLVSVAAPFVLGAGVMGELPLGRMLTGIMVTTLLPLGLGMALNARWPQPCLRWEPRLRRLSGMIFLAIVIATFATNLATFRLHGAALLGPLLLLNVLAMLGGVLLARFGRLGRAQAIAIAFETGLQNAALAIFIAVSVLGDPLYAVPAVIYAAVMNVSVLAAVGLARNCPALSGGGENDVG